MSNRTNVTGPISSAHIEPTFIPSLRMTIATAVLQGMMAGGADKSNSIDFLVDRSIAYADKMLEKLSEPT